MTTRLRGRRSRPRPRPLVAAGASRAATGEEEPGFRSRSRARPATRRGSRSTKATQQQRPGAAAAGRGRLHRLRLRLRHHALPRDRRRRQRRRRRDSDDVERRGRRRHRRRLAGRDLAERRRPRLRHPRAGSSWRPGTASRPQPRQVRRTSGDAVGVGRRPDRRARRAAHADPVLRPEQRARRSTRTTRTSARAGRSALPTEYFGTQIDPAPRRPGRQGRAHLPDQRRQHGRLSAGSARRRRRAADARAVHGVWGHPAVYGGQGGWVYVLESAGGGDLAGAQLRPQRQRRTGAQRGRHQHRILRLHLRLAARDQQRHGRRQRGRVGGLPPRATPARAASLRAYARDARGRQRCRCCGRARSAPPRSSRCRPPPKGASTWATARAN